MLFHALLWLLSLLLWGLARARDAHPLSARASTSTVPAPIVIPASQEFEGNDGPWSTFTLRLGTPAQNVNIMVSTASYQTWAVVPQGCVSSDPSNCAALRGGEFNYNSSSTWKQNGESPNGTFALPIESNLGYTDSPFGLYGYDTIGLGLQGSGGPSLDQQILAGIATKQFYFGVFGLNPRPTNFTDYNAPVNSYISNLKAQNIIPSLTWSYTAGNQYRLDKVLGSLTLGGYDGNRFEKNNVEFEFDEQDKRDLSVEISLIVYTEDGRNTTLLSDPISALLDSTVPWIYLPLAACLQFESAFGLEYDNSSAAYLVNDTLHEKLQADNASVTFTLQNAARSGSVDITLPYAAFDLIAQYPLAQEGENIRYFPLARAANESQYTLGRAFFQEAYISANYETNTFTVSQCSWIPGSRQSIVPIPSLDNSGSSNSNSTSTPSKHSSTGAIAGGAVGGIVGLALLGTAGYFIFTKIIRPRRNKGKGPAELDNDGERKPELDSKVNAHEVTGESFYGHEIDSKHHPGYELVAARKPGHELDSGPHAVEMPAREAPAAELP